MYKRITKKQTKTARERTEKLLNDVRKLLKDKYKFSSRLVGSAKWGTAIEDENGMYDLDYQLILTANSKMYKTNKLKQPTNIKDDFFGAFSASINNEEKIENSTSAITLVHKDKNIPYTIDFVILRTFPDPIEIIRRNNKKDTPHINEFTWNPLPKHNEAYDKFNSLNPDDKKDLIENYIIPKKYKEKKKQDNDPTKLSSCELFVREVNNYVVRKRNH